MNEQRRRYGRINVKVIARGALMAAGTTLDFVASIVNLSPRGAFMQLSDDTKERLSPVIAGLEDIGGARIEVRLISYVVENVSVSARFIHVQKLGNDIIIGVEFESPDEDTRSLIGHLLENRPDLVKDSPQTKEDYRFTSLDEFIQEVTTFSLLVGKKEKFWIGKEPFVFAGMHISGSGEAHTDVIESVRRQDLLYCPDCREYLKPHHLT